jgi:hypothetical protein
MAFFVVTSCAKSDFGNDHNQGSVKVGFYAGGNQTRTEMLSNGLSARWVPDDQLALWAVDNDGEQPSYALSNQIFSAHGLDSSRGFFTSTLDSQMEEGVYTYYCTYPVPISYSGSTATFSLPAVQDGKVSNGVDIMISDPVVHGPLLSIPDPDDHSTMSMTMNRMMHQFRFYIPEDNEIIGDEELTRIIATFPKNVVGKVTYDLTNVKSNGELLGGELTEGSNRITMNLSTPLGKSSVAPDKFACMAMVPTEFADGEKMTLKLCSPTKVALVDPVNLFVDKLVPENQTVQKFKAGHSTPVKLKIKELIDYPYTIRFTLTGNNVGEPVISVKFTAPENAVWPTSGTNEYTYNPGRNIAVGETVEFKFPDYEECEAFSGQDITIELETENAISTSVSKVGTIPEGVKAHVSNISAAMPYLLYQDFSSIPNYSDGHDDPTVGLGSDTYKGITELSGIGLTDWYGTRIGIEGGKSARICCRYECVKVFGLGSSAYYKGRLYTPKLSILKPGKDVKISVSYDYGSNRKEASSKQDKSPIIYFGCNTQDIVTNPDANEGNILDQVTGLVAGSGYASSAPSSLSPRGAWGVYLDKANGSYTNLPKSETQTINDVDRNMRLGWILSTDNTSSNTNANYWFYIDNIKVTIANN